MNWAIYDIIRRLTRRDPGNSQKIAEIRAPNGQIASEPKGALEAARLQGIDIHKPGISYDKQVNDLFDWLGMQITSITPQARA